MTVEEGAFTITSTVGTGSDFAKEFEAGEKSSAPERASGGDGGGPSPRFGAAMAVAKSGQLFLFGGMIEDGDKQITLNDFYSLGESVGPSSDFLSFEMGRRNDSNETMEGASNNDIHKNLEFFDPLFPLSAFGTDLCYKIHATSLTTSAFP